MRENEGFRLEPLSEEDMRIAAENGNKCQLNAPLTFQPDGTEYCKRPVAFIVRQKLGGEIVKCWYSCEECAAPIIKGLDASGV